MIKDNSFSSKMLDVIVHVTMIVVVLVTLYPVLYVFSASLSSAAANDRGIVTIFPREFTVEAYKMIWKAKTVPFSFLNSVLYTSVGTALNLLLTGALAYALSRKNLALRKFYTAIIIFSMYFSGGMIPSFLLIKNIHLYNTMWALILPGLIGTTNLIIMRTFFQSIPKELEESANLDGANDFVIFFKIIIPLSKAAICTIGLYYAVGHWNAWFNAMIYLKDTAKYPLQMILRQIVIQTSALQEAAQSGDLSAINEIGVVNVTAVKFATLTVSILPMLMIYPFIQKYFIKGVMIGSLKG
jgi:ABC-type sugar transport system, permease component